jgi:hypothetical protein
MSYYLKVIKDNPIALWKLDETSGTTAYDASGCGNNATYNSSFQNNLMPLVSGGIQGTKITNDNSITFPITKDYYGSTSGGGVADKYSTDNDFSLELWFYPKISSGLMTNIFVDQQSNCGIYYHNNNIIFKVGDYSLRYLLPYIKKSYHIVAQYSVNNIFLYVDGYLVNSINVTNEVSLTNTQTTFTSGPTPNISDSFIVDAPAVYRCTLSKEKVLSHYVHGQPINTIQVVTPKEGTLFRLSDQNLKKVFNYSYPLTKSWENFITNNIVYNQIDQSISIAPSTIEQERYIEFNDFIMIPQDIGLEFSKIEWSGEPGVSIETSTDGETYFTCKNGQNIPQYANGNFDPSGVLYVKFILLTSDASLYQPKLNYLNISFYKNKDISADNFGDTITQNGNEYYLGNKDYNILSRYSRNGLECQEDSGFILNTENLINTLEFFYTPFDIYKAGQLVSSEDGNGYTGCDWIWDNSGNISSSNIQDIYVNGQFITAESSIFDIFENEEIYHVVITFTEPISGDIKFNFNDGDAIQALYKNIAIYQQLFSEELIQEHYGLYIENPSTQVNILENALSITENEVLLYDNDWVVIQNS